jgi:hypothetical protein
METQRITYWRSNRWNRWRITGAFTTLTAAGLSTFSPGAAVSAIGLGGNYLSAAVSKGCWNPAKWKLESTQTWFSAFNGFTTFLCITSAYKNISS